MKPLNGIEEPTKSERRHIGFPIPCDDQGLVGNALNMCGPAPGNLALQAIQFGPELVQLLLYRLLLRSTVNHCQEPRERIVRGFCLR